MVSRSAFTFRLWIPADRSSASYHPQCSLCHFAFCLSSFAERRLRTHYCFIFFEPSKSGNSTPQITIRATPMQIKSGFTRPLNLKFTLKAQTMRIEFKKAPISKIWPAHSELNVFFGSKAQFKRLLHQFYFNRYRLDLTVKWSQLWAACDDRQLT